MSGHYPSKMQSGPAILLLWAGIRFTRARGDDGGGDDGDGWPQTPGWQTPTEARLLQESFSWHECSMAILAKKADSALSIKRGTGVGSGAKAELLQ
jgi:hypothetical protein